MIVANQALHGYATGHQLLASSFEWNSDDRKKLDVLSDLSGRCNEQRFQDYYTGYPLTDGKQYVIAKTWYAEEIPRPGCVWTQSVIFCTEDIAHIQNVREITELFHRPLENDYNTYRQKVTLKAGLDDIRESYDPKLLEYFVYTIYGSGQTRIVYFEEGVHDSIKEFLMCLKVMPVELLKNFSFCTMSYDMRVYDNEYFSYQIMPKDIAMSMKRRIQEAEICIPYERMERFPFWVKCFSDCLCAGNVQEVYDFIFQYGNSTCNWETYNGFLRLYFLLANKKDLQLREYLEAVSFVMKEYGEEIIQITINLLLEETFRAYTFNLVDYQILELLDQGMFKLSKKQQKDLENRVS